MSMFCKTAIEFRLTTPEVTGYISQSRFIVASVKDGFTADEALKSVKDYYSTSVVDCVSIKENKHYGDHVTVIEFPRAV